MIWSLDWFDSGEPLLSNNLNSLDFRPIWCVLITVSLTFSLLFWTSHKSLASFYLLNTIISQINHRILIFVILSWYVSCSITSCSRSFGSRSDILFNHITQNSMYESMLTESNIWLNYCTNYEKHRGIGITVLNIFFTSIFHCGHLISMLAKDHSASLSNCEWLIIPWGCVCIENARARRLVRVHSTLALDRRRGKVRERETYVYVTIE